MGLFLSLPSLSRPAVATEIYGLSDKSLELYAGNGLLFEWRVQEARALVDRLLKESPQDPAIRRLEARVLFFEGRYEEARNVIHRFHIQGSFTDLVEVTAKATDRMTSRRSEHFAVYWADPRDEVLISPALETLEKARMAVSRDLGFAPEDPVRIEIYPTISLFTDVSTLTRKEVRTSGTIGLCKFNRLMIASPRSTLDGYTWRDTLSHEYVHLAVYRLSRGRAPIWVHEGIAKYLEGSWRGVYGNLNPSSKALLAKRLDAGTLISLEQMTPSVAKLDSAEDTELAFAEVGTMMGFLVEQRGFGALGRLVAEIGRGLEDRAALESVWGGSFTDFDTEWKTWVRSQPLEEREIQVLPLTLADEASGTEEPEAIPDRQAEDYVRIGDLLRERNRDAAAAFEYQKAYQQAPDLAGVASRNLWGQMTLGQYNEAVAVSDRALRIYPDLAPLWSRKGIALLQLKKYPEAVQAFQALMEINPFHIPGRRGYLAAALAMGDKEEARRQEWALSLLEKQAGH